MKICYMIDEKFQNLFNGWKKEFDAELKSKNNIAIDLITNSKQK